MNSRTRHAAVAGQLEILCSRAYAALRERELVNPKGDSRRLLDDYRRLVSVQVVVSRELGLTPAARLAIKQSSKDAPVDLVGEFARDASDERRQIEP